MTRTHTLGALAVLGAALALGCGKKDPDGGTPDGNPFGSGRTASDKKDAARRLKQIGVALHNYHDSNGTFPAGVVGPKGQLGLSWRVALLPYLEHESLHRQFKLNEAWDSPHNKALLSQMPKVYESPGASAVGGKTYFRAFSGPGGFVPGPAMGPKGPLQNLWAGMTPGLPARGRRINDFMDGTSNSFMVVEVGDPVEWTKPDDLPFHDQPGVTTGPKSQLPNIDPFKDGGFIALFGDASTRFISAKEKDQTLRAAISINGGEAYTFEYE